jgi:serine/threonine-protein kinase
VAVCFQCKSIIYEQEARFCPHCGVQQPREKPRSRIEAGAEVSLEQWGKVVVGERLGEGGMGVVFRGWLYYNPTGPRAGSPAHPVAVKVLHPLLRGRDKVRRLFVSEAAALQRLSHPNIVHFFALAQEHMQLAIVLELVEGLPLSDVIEQHVRDAQAGSIPCMPFVKAWHYFSQLLGALAAIHALGIIHRDVKPSNVLVRTDGVAKLTDFGIAQVPADEVRDTGGMAPGTGAYMSPEQVSGKDLDPRADVYSAAIVLYEMLAGISPFEAPDRNEIMIRAAQLEEAPPPITRLVPQAPPVLDMLMARALAKDRTLRFGSAIEMGEAFRRALGLPESSGWDAQQQFAKKAKAISQVGRPAPTVSDEASEQAAEQLRTGIMAAYRT